MGGIPASLAGAHQPYTLFTGGAQRFDAGDNRPPTAGQEAQLKLLVEAFPGLAGALYATSLYHDAPMQGLTGWSQPHDRCGFEGSFGTEPKPDPLPAWGVSEFAAPYADQPSFHLASADSASPQASAKPHVPSSSQPHAGSPAPNRLDTKDNIDQLAKIITSEASNGNYTERSSVGFTVLNRMRRNGTARVSGVSSGFAKNQAPSSHAIALAKKILRGGLADPTNGAPHFYSPAGMPKEGEHTGRYDVGGGLEQSGHLKKKNFRPAYTRTFLSLAVPGVSEEDFKFWRAPGNGAVE